MNYFHLYDPIENLRIKASLRLVGTTKVRDDVKNATSSTTSGNLEGSGQALPSNMKKEWTSTISWQEKIFSPNELVKYKAAAEERAILFKSHHNVTETEYIEDIKTRLQSGSHLLVCYTLISSLTGRYYTSFTYK